MRDIHSEVGVVSALGPVVGTADATSAAVDLQGFQAAEVVVSVGIGGITFDATNKIEFKVLHSDDDVTYTAIGSADALVAGGVGAGGIIKALTAAHAAAAAYKAGYIGGKRYIKAFADFSGTHATGTPYTVNVLRAEAAFLPVA